MTTQQQQTGYAKYWTMWGSLLLLSMGMLLFSTMPLPRSLLIPLWIVGMLLMAYLIAKRFMHLENEKAMLVLTVAFTTLILSAILFLLLSVDGKHILTHAP